ncbi:MAG: hypothetical protein AB7Q29_07240 [Vicinamibacterales bacterium]
MARINGARVIIGGLLAGLLLNIGDFLINGVLLADEFRAGLVRLGLDPVALEAASVTMRWVAVDFALGLLLVWTYASMRPRFGPGPRTAILAFVPTFVAITSIMFGLAGMGFFTLSLFSKITAYSAVNAIVASLAGAWAYKESPDGRMR